MSHRPLTTQITTPLRGASAAPKAPAAQERGPVQAGATPPLRSGPAGLRPRAAYGRLLPLVAVLVGGGLLGAAEGDVPPAVAAKLAELDQQIRILARKAEIAQEEADAKAKTGAGVFANEKDGFGVKSNDGFWKLRLRGLLQVDARVFLGDEGDVNPAAKTSSNGGPYTNQLLVRRFRPILEAALGPNLDATLVPDFGGNPTAVQIIDAYLDAKYIPNTIIRVGKFITPVGQDQLNSTAALPFPERALVSNLTSSRDTGVQISSDFGGGTFGYAAGIFNGVPDNTQNAGEAAGSGLPSGDGKEFAGKVWFNPVAAFQDPSLYSEIGLAGSFGQEEGSSGTSNLPSYRSSGQNTIFAYRGAAGTAGAVFAHGQHTRVDPYARFYSGPFSIFGEYIVAQQALSAPVVADQSVTQDELFTHKAWSLSTGWVLTGENASWKGVVPRAPLDPAAGNWGAFELVARVHQISFDADAFDPISGTAAVANKLTSVRKATAIGAGINWYWSRQVRVGLTYEVTSFEDGAATTNAAGVASTNLANVANRETERLINSRVQFNF